MKPKTFLSALSAVVLIGNASCALFTKSLNGFGVDTIELAEHIEEKEVKSLSAIVEDEAPVVTENLKTVHELELEQPVQRAQNGKLVFVKSIGGNSDICTISFEPEEEPRPMHINENDLIKGNDDKTEYFACMTPKFSPDGSKIVFSRRNKFGFGATIYIMDQDGQNLKEIGDGYFPCFTPDGQRIAASENLGQIFTCDLDGEDKRILVPKNLRVVYLPEFIRYINFTPDGNRIYFIIHSFNAISSFLRIADAVTGEIIQRFIGVERASFSPDCKFIVYVDSNRAMRIMDVESGRIFENFPGTGGTYFDVIWSPDGGNIFYYKSGSCGLYDISFVDGTPILKTNMERRISGAQNFAWQSLPI